MPEIILKTGLFWLPVWRLPFTVSWPCCSWACVKTARHGGERVAEQAAHLMAARRQDEKEEETRVPQLPSRVVPVTKNLPLGLTSHRPHPFPIAPGQGLSIHYLGLQGTFTIWTEALSFSIQARWHVFPLHSFVHFTSWPFTWGYLPSVWILSLLQRVNSLRTGATLYTSLYLLCSDNQHQVVTIVDHYPDTHFESGFWLFCSGSGWSWFWSLQRCIEELSESVSISDS